MLKTVVKHVKNSLNIFHFKQNCVRAKINLKHWLYKFSTMNNYIISVKKQMIKTHKDYLTSKLFAFGDFELKLLTILVN